MRSNEKKAATAALMFASLVFSLPPAATAASPDTTQMTIQARVPAVCRVENATTLDFAEVDNAFGADTDGSATVDWRCTRNTSASIEIDGGMSGTRKMTSGATSTPLAYELYQNPARDQRWGSASEAVSVNGKGMNDAEPLTVYGRVDYADAEVADPSNDYSDVVTISISW